LANIAGLRGNRNGIAFNPSSLAPRGLPGNRPGKAQTAYLMGNKCATSSEYADEATKPALGSQMCYVLREPFSYAPTTNTGDL